MTLKKFLGGGYLIDSVYRVTVLYSNRAVSYEVNYIARIEGYKTNAQEHVMTCVELPDEALKAEKWMVSYNQAEGMNEIMVNVADN